MFPILSTFARSAGRTGLARAATLKQVRNIIIPQGEAIQAKREPSECVGAERFLMQNITRNMYRTMSSKPLQKDAKELAPSVTHKKPATKKKPAREVGSYVAPPKSSTKQDQARAHSVSCLMPHSFRPLPIEKPVLKKPDARTYTMSVGNVNFTPPEWKPNFSQSGGMES